MHNRAQRVDRRASRDWLTVLLPLLGIPVGAAAQDAPGVDFSRAYVVDYQIFAPFRVSETTALAGVVEEGILTATTPILVMEHPKGRLALVTDQMAYHHVAQGEIMGEPWMVSF